MTRISTAFGISIFTPFKTIERFLYSLNALSSYLHNDPISSFGTADGFLRVYRNALCVLDIEVKRIRKMIYYR